MSDFDLDAYDYHLPEELIAQRPAPQRQGSRLLVLDCSRPRPADSLFARLPELLRPGDLLVVNDTRVFPARLAGRKETGGRCEVFLLEPPGKTGPCACLFKSSRPPRPGQQITVGPDFVLIVEESRAGAGSVRALDCDFAAMVERYGRVPLPPYIRRDSGEAPEDRERYQTVYAEKTGAVAAPTAGLHFTPELLGEIEGLGVATARVTLHVGYGTFAPVRTQDIREHRIHEEYVECGPETAALVNETRRRGGRVWAVGTTSARALEWAADEDGGMRARKGACGLYIYPGYRFRVVENLLTNFHLPRSSLMFLVSALAGRERILAAYAHAVRQGYRFFSYGDAMAIITRPSRQEAASRPFGGTEGKRQKSKGKSI